MQYQGNNSYRKLNRLGKYLSQIPQCDHSQSEEHTDGELAVCVVCWWLMGFFFLPFCSRRQIGFLHLFIFQMCRSQVILAYRMCKRFCFHTVVLPCGYCFQLKRSYWFKPGRSKWAMSCLSDRVHFQLMLIVVVKLMSLCVCAWMHMRSRIINIQLG